MLGAEERAQLRSLLGRLAAAHGLADGMHPGYRTLGAQEKGRAPGRRDQPDPW